MVVQTAASDPVPRGPSAGSRDAPSRSCSLCVPIQAMLSGDTIHVLGSVDVVFADFGMQAPNFGFVTTQNHGTIEFQLDFVRA